MRLFKVRVSVMRISPYLLMLLMFTDHLQGHEITGGAPHGHTVQNGPGGSQVQMIEKGKYRFMVSNGIPDHEPGVFPRRGNPNHIRPQSYTFRIPLNPKEVTRRTPVGMNRFGVALNGVPFDPAAAEWWNRNPRSGWTYEANSGKIDLGLDEHHAHVQPDGGYHYHGSPTGLVDLASQKSDQTSREGQMILLGYAADGFPIYSGMGHSDPKDPESELITVKPSYQLKEGNRPSGPGGKYDGMFVEDYHYVANSGDLDACNGRVGVTPEYPEGIYHYYITDEFPFIPRYFQGTPDQSFAKQRPNGPPGGGPPGGGPRGGRRPPPPGGGTTSSRQSRKDRILKSPKA